MNPGNMNASGWEMILMQEIFFNMWLIGENGLLPSLPQAQYLAWLDAPWRQDFISTILKLPEEVKCFATTLNIKILLPGFVSNYGLTPHFV